MGAGGPGALQGPLNRGRKRGDQKGRGEESNGEMQAGGGGERERHGIMGLWEFDVSMTTASVCFSAGSITLNSILLITLFTDGCVNRFCVFKGAGCSLQLDRR